VSDFEQWLADHTLVRDTVHDYAADCLRRVPTMTPVTLGHNIRGDLRTLVIMAQDGETLRHIGWGDQITLPQESLRTELLRMVDDLGPNWHLFDETRLAQRMVRTTCEACGGLYHRPYQGCVRPKLLQIIKRG
jgi:hypothetical protein